MFVRPTIYFLVRYFIRLGFLDGTEGLIFHFLQGFWFRFLIDAKIYELEISKGRRKSNATVKFFLLFITFFLMFYYFNIVFFDLTIPGKHYNSFFANYLNYIQGLRWALLTISAKVLNLMGFAAVNNNYELLVAGRGSITVVYSCLGFGVISFFSAFVLAYPEALRTKIIFVISGIFIIEILNMLRFILIVLFWNKTDNKIFDHHTIFNLFIYTLVLIALSIWVLKVDGRNKKYGGD